MIGNNEEKIFVYKLTADNGGAPCVYNGKLSLCICKPRIRISAKKNDWIVGFGGKSVGDLKDRLIYVAQVTEKISNGDYYKKPEYLDRPDCIYQWNEDEEKFKFKEGAKFHDEDCLNHDLGDHPNYSRAYSLLSDNFIYLGNTPVNKYKELFDGIRVFYDSLPRDFIQNIDDEHKKSLVKFVNEIIECFGYGKHGKPIHADTTKKCDQTEGYIQETTCIGQIKCR